MILFRLTKLQLLTLIFMMLGSAVSSANTNNAESYTLLQSGDNAYNAGDYQQAVADFKSGYNLLTGIESKSVLKSELADRYATAASQEAKRLTKLGKLQEAKTLLKEVLSEKVAPRNTAALKALEQLNDPIRTNPALTENHAQNVDSVRRLLYKGEGAYNLGKFDDAKSHYESVLRIDPYNKAARRGMERVSNRQSDYYRSAYDETRARHLLQIDKGWELPVATGDVVEHSEIINQYQAGQAAQNASVAQKLASIILPRVDFEQADLYEVLDFLRAQSRVLDTYTLDETSKGVQFFVNAPNNSPIFNKKITLKLSNIPIKKVINSVATLVGATVGADDFAVVFTSYGQNEETMIVRSYNVSPDFLSKSRKSSTSDDPFSSSEATSSGSLIAEKLTAQELLQEMGVTFEGRSTASFIPATSTLIVKNSPDQIETVSNIVQALAKQQPAMVRLDVKLISVQQMNNEGIGVDWTISGTLENALGLGSQISGGSTGNGAEINDLTGRPVTSGLRTGSFATRVDSIDSVLNRTLRTPSTSVTSFDPFILANNDGNLDSALLSETIFKSGEPGSSGVANAAPGIFSVQAGLFPNAAQAMLRGLSQKTGTDFISQPSIVTRSGQLATLQMGQEFLYPTEYDPPELSQATLTGQRAGLENRNSRVPTDATWWVRYLEETLEIDEIMVNETIYSPSSVAVTPSHPSSYEKALIGTDLEIEPTLGENKKTIQLNVRSTYKDFDGFVNYGSPISAVTTLVDFDEEVIPFLPGDIDLDDDADDDDDNINNPTGDTYVTFWGSDLFPPGPLLFDRDFLGGGVSVTQRIGKATDNNILMPVFSTINSETSVTIYDGATVIIGGLINARKVPVTDNVPILSKIPIIGRAFESNSEETITKQILIAITATVIDPTGRPLNSPH